MTYDFAKVPVSTIDGLSEVTDLSRILSSALFYGARDVSLATLGQDIYKGKGAIELEKELKESLSAFVQNYPEFTYIVRSSLLAFIK